MKIFFDQDKICQYLETSLKAENIFDKDSASHKINL